jgi:hypothetical protein
MQVTDECPQHRDIDLLHRGNRTDPILKVIREAVEVFAVRLQRQFGRIALELQVSQKTLSSRLHESPF